MKKHKLKRKTLEFDELITAESIKHVALALVSVFIPIYLYKLGYGLQDILFFFLVNQATYLFMVRPAGALALFFHPKRTICLSYILMLVSLFSLYLLPSRPELFYLTAALAGVAECIFWVPYHVNFTRLIDKQNAGKRVSTMDIAVKITGVIGPAVGGYVAYLFGGKWLFFAAAILLAIATLPLLATKDTVRQKKVHYEKLKIRSILPDLLGYASRAIGYLVAAVTWPLFLGIVLVNYAAIGLVVSSAMFAGLFIVLIVGYITDKGGDRYLIAAGSTLAVVVNIVRIGAGATGAAIATVLDNIAESLIKTPFMSTAYKNANKAGRMEYMVRLEQAAFVARVSVLLILICATYAANIETVLYISFIIAAVTSLGANLIKKRT